MRWDALQSLWLKYFAPDASLQDVDLVQLIGSIARQALQLRGQPEQQLLTATMLTVPEENYLFEELEQFEVYALLDRREALLDSLAKSHQELWLEVFEAFRDSGSYSPDASGMANRALANLAFGFAARAMNDQSLARFVEARYLQADNLTDRRAALTVACRHPDMDADAKQGLLQDFYDRWHGEALVLDQWFSLQASSGLTSVDGLRQLEAHEKFELKNPNRARSVLSAFGMYNHRTLHNPDGSGYVYLADAVGRMDKLNPQVAARLATPLTRWQRYDAKRQIVMQASLQSLLEAEDISKDLYEIVSKSLA